MLAEPAVGKFGRVLPDSVTDAPNAGVVKALTKDE